MIHVPFNTLITYPCLKAFGGHKKEIVLNSSSIFK